MKYSDDLYDVSHNSLYASFFGLVCGVISAVACIIYPGSSYIFISIIFGNLIAFKIDGSHHLIALISFIILCLIFGIPNFNLVILLICILAAFGDEMGHELFAKNQSNSFLSLFFEYRFLMKIVVFLLAIFNAFDIMIFIYFILFEVSYLMGGWVFEKLN